MTQINLYELLAVRAALCTFGLWLAGQRVIAFVDNTAALGMLVRGWSRASDANEISGECWHEIAALSLDLLFVWVPCELNLADGPSRTWRCVRVPGTRKYQRVRV